MFPTAALRPYIELTRLNKPIGILLLLWPTMGSLWLASGGMPSNKLLFIFVSGVILMRSAGCIVNDVFDRNFDGHVQRTRLRPLVTGVVSVKSALLLAAVLVALSFLLVLFTNRLTILLSFVGAALAVIYPLLKRVTHLPQFGLGAAFSWGVPMAFAAVTGEVAAIVWMVYLAAVLWPVIYDTMYAMTDRADDVRVGVKSTAILFGKYDIFILACLMSCLLILMISIGQWFNLNACYYVSLFIAALLFAYQLWLIRERHPEKCFQAFLQNNYIGLVVFAGVVLGLR